MKHSEHVTIRRAAARDCASLTQLMHKSRAYTGAYAAILEGYSITPWQISRNPTYLAEEGGAMLGFYSLELHNANVELDLMFVADEAQGRGLGARMFQHMLAEARILGRDQVVIVSHPRAEGFYLHMGAKRVGTAPPSGRVTWTRPRLVASVNTAPRAPASR